jgi:hypothetical protein
MFHGTISDQIDSIKKEGLRKLYSGTVHPGLSKSVVYMTSDRREAQGWARMAVRKLELAAIREHGYQYKGFKGVPAVIEVHIPKKHSTYLRWDRNFQHTIRTTGSTVNWEFLLDVEPKWIRGITVQDRDEGWRTAAALDDENNVVIYIATVLFDGTELRTAASEHPVLADQIFQWKKMRGLAMLQTLGGAGSGNFGHAGRPGEVGGSAPGFGAAPLTKKGVAAWRKAHQSRYTSDKDFRAAVDAVTLLTQGSTSDIRAASLAAAGHESELVGRTYNLDKPLSYAANPMGSYKTYFDGQDVENAEYVTLREAGVALNNAIDTSPVLDEPIYRGMSVQRTLWMEAGQQLDPVSGQIVVTDEEANERQRARERKTGDYSQKNQPNPFYQQIDGIKAGDPFDIPGVTSFTVDKFTATQFSRGEARGQGGRGGDGRRHTSAVTLEIRSSRGIPVAALSPWDQKEVLTRGRFKVESVIKTPYSNFYDYHVVLRPR